MNDRVLSTVAIIAGALALFGGIWGLLDHAKAGDSEGNLEEAMMWISIDLILLAVSAVANALAGRARASRTDVAPPR